MDTVSTPRSVCCADFLPAGRVRAPVLALSRMKANGDVTARSLYFELLRLGCDSLSEEQVLWAVKSFDFDADRILSQAEFVHMLTAAYALE